MYVRLSALATEPGIGLGISADFIAKKRGLANQVGPCLRDRWLIKWSFYVYKKTEPSSTVITENYDVI
jgi:hypothetical protein